MKNPRVQAWRILEFAARLAQEDENASVSLFHAAGNAAPVEEMIGRTPNLKSLLTSLGNYAAEVGGGKVAKELCGICESPKEASIHAESNRKYYWHHDFASRI